MTDQQGGIRIGDLLVRAGVVTAADCAEAERLSIEMKAQFGRLLILAGCLTEESLACALEAQAFIKQGVISFDIAIEALAFAVEEKMSLEEALELLDLLPQFGTATLELAKLVGEAKIVPEDALIEALEHSVQTNIPLSEVLLAEQLISNDMLGLLNVLHEQIRTNSLDRALAVKDLRAEYSAWRRGNYSTKSSRNKIPSFPQVHEVRKTFHQMKAMMPVQPHAAPEVRPQPAQPVASSSSASGNDFAHVQSVPQPAAPPVVPFTSSASAFKGFSADKNEAPVEEQNKGLDVDKMQMLKSLAFAGPVGAPLPLLIDDSLPAVPIAALPAADHWNSFDGAAAPSQFSKPAPPPPPAQPAFNPFGSGPDFYSEPPTPKPISSASAFQLPSPTPPPVPVEPSFFAPPAKELPSQSSHIPSYEVPPDPVLKSGPDNWSWNKSEASAAVPSQAPSQQQQQQQQQQSASDEDGLDWSWAPSPEELAEAERSPSRYAWEDDPVEPKASAEAPPAASGEARFVWDSAPERAISNEPPVVPIPSVSQSFAPSSAPPSVPSTPVETAAKSADSTKNSELPVVDPEDSGKFTWVSDPNKKELPAEEETASTAKNLSAEESIAALAEASMASQFSDSAETVQADAVSGAFKWDPPEYADSSKEVISKSTDSDDALASLDIDSQIKEQPKAQITPLSLNFEKSSFGLKEPIEKQADKVDDDSLKVKSERDSDVESARVESKGKQRSEADEKRIKDAEEKLLAEKKAKAELEGRFAAEKKTRTELEAKLATEKKAKAELEEKLVADNKAKEELEKKLQDKLAAETKAKIELVNKLTSEAKTKVVLQEKLASEEKAKAELQEKLAEQEKEKSTLEEKLAAEVKARADAKEEQEGKTTAAVVAPVKKGKKKGRAVEAVDEEVVHEATNVSNAGEVPSLVRPENPDLLHLLKAANCFVEANLQESFVTALNDPATSLELLKILNVIDKATLDSAARINKLVKDGTIEMTQGVESLTGIQTGEIKHADLTKALGLDKAKPKAKPKAKRKR